MKSLNTFVVIFLACLLTACPKADTIVTKTTSSFWSPLILSSRLTTRAGRVYIQVEINSRQRGVCDVMVVLSQRRKGASLKMTTEKKRSGVPISAGQKEYAILSFPIQEDFVFKYVKSVISCRSELS